MTTSDIVLSREQKRTLSAWASQKNSTLSAFSFGKLKNNESFYTHLGFALGDIEYVGISPKVAVTRKQIISHYETWKWNNLEPALNGYVKPEQQDSWYFPTAVGDDFKPAPSSLVEPAASASVVKHAAEPEPEPDLKWELEFCEQQTAKLYWFQNKAASQILHNLLAKDMRGQLLLAGVGLGKTFIVGAVLTRIINHHRDRFLDKCLSPMPIVYVTKSPVVEQTRRVFETHFGIDCLNTVTVVNIEQMRSKFGEFFVKEETRIVNGEPEIYYKWRPHLNPIAVLWDECQALKNEDSTQSKIAQALNDCETPCYQIFISATPFTRVAEAKCFAVSTQHKIQQMGMYAGKILTNKIWKEYSRIVASPSEPEEYNEAAVGRLVSDMMPYIVDVKGVHPQFKARNQVKQIQFANEREKQRYESAWERFLEEKIKLEGSEGSTGFAILVEFLKFRQEAELIRAPYLAKAALEILSEGRAPIIACNFKLTIAKVVDILVNDYNVSRDRISLIWGGNPEKKLSEKAAKAKKISSDSKAMDLLAEAGLSLADFNLDKAYTAFDQEQEAEVESLVAKKHLRLGAQSKKQRQEEIDKFQRQESDVCLFTFKSGGAGLSLHHTDEHTEFKCRRKESGYVIEEDIPKVPTKQREVLLAPTYSAIELVQGLGRGARINSLSDTYQTVIFYSGTIEQSVAWITSQKLKCLKKVVRQRESWEGCIMGANKGDEHKSLPSIEVEGVATEEDEDLIGSDEQED